VKLKILMNKLKKLDKKIEEKLDKKM